MKFLNKKEQILQIELTQYGKHLLSKGIFDPMYYAFYDDNILYDSEYAGITGEHQNEVEGRVTQDTPQLETQYVFSSIGDSIRKVNKYIRSKDEEYHTYGLLSELGSEATQPQAAQFHALAGPLGTSQLDKQSAPSWTIRVLNGEISGTVNLLTGSYQNSFIPQITTEPITYKYKIIEGSTGSFGEPLAPELNPEVDLTSDNVGANPTALEELTSQTGLGYGEFVDQFDDGNYLAIYDDSLLLEVTENNVPYENENYDIEVFKVEEQLDVLTNVSKSVLIPLYFSKIPDLIQNDILLDPDEIGSSSPISDIDPSYVDYFFNIRVDKEIDRQMLIEARDKISITEQAKKGIPGATPRETDQQIADLYSPINVETEDTATDDECDD